MVSGGPGKGRKEGKGKEGGSKAGEVEDGFCVRLSKPVSAATVHGERSQDAEVP